MSDSAQIFNEDDFEEAKRKNFVGKGAYGMVYRLQKKGTNDFFAVKFYDST